MSDLSKRLCKEYVMPFGQYAGKRLDDIPLTYLDWLLGVCKQPSTRAAIKSYLSDPVIARELQTELDKES